jgi:hypothetical protein
MVFGEDSEELEDSEGVACYKNTYTNIPLPAGEDR